MTQKQSWYVTPPDVLLMTKKEKLEYAAKAARMLPRLGWGFDSDAPYYTNGPKAPEPTYWDPLENIDDAFSLNARLRGRVMYHDGGVSVYIEGDVQGYFVDITDDKLKSTCMAIVDAAAAHGRAMK